MGIWPTRQTYIAVALVGLWGCGEPQAPTVLVLASASTADAVEEIAAAYSLKHSVEIRVSAGGSNALARQIEAGIAADVFVSASEEWGAFVEAKGRVRARTDLLSNRLVLIVPKGNPAGVHAPSDLLRPEVRFVALAGEKVPAGVYAGQALAAGGTFDQLVAAKRIVRGQDVRAALGYVERGEAQAGVVYATDARVGAGVESVYTFPESSHPPIVYPALLLRSSPVDGPGERFYEALQGAEARAVFERRGFRFVAGGPK